MVILSSASYDFDSNASVFALGGGGGGGGSLGVEVAARAERLGLLFTGQPVMWHSGHDDPVIAVGVGVEAAAEAARELEEERGPSVPHRIALHDGDLRS